MVRHAGFEPALSEILSFRPLPIGLLTQNRVAREIRTLDVLRRVPSAGRDKLVASSGLEPPSMRLEGAGPHSLGEAELERVMGVEPIKITVATSSRASL